MRPKILTLAAALALAAPAFAQQPAAAPQPLKVTVKLVVVPTVVRDKHNALVSSLTRDDFALNVDGKPQTIRYFDHDNNVPLTVGLLIDTSMSQREVLDDERSASVAFLQKMLAPDRDKAFLVQFAHDVNLLQDVTTSTSRLAAAIRDVDADRPSFNRDSSTDQGSGRDHGRSDHSGGTALYDAVFLASDEVISKQTGRRALILLTDGDDRGSMETLPKAIEAAQRADTILYAIYYHSDHSNWNHGGGYGGGHHGGGFPGGGGGGYPGGGHGGGYDRVDGKKVLERMCTETGGRVFEVSNKETVDKIYTEIGEELRSQYRLGFTPSEQATSPGYHQIDLTLTGKLAKDKDHIQTRDGYYQN